MQKIEAAADEVGVFGYGSLLLSRSFESTLGRPYGRERYACSVAGWRRRWTSLYPNKTFYFATAEGARSYPENILYLNVEAGEGRVNGVVYIVSLADLEGFDRREAVYHRVQAPPGSIDLDCGATPVYLYAGFDPYVMRAPMPVEKAAIRRTYIEIVEGGLAELGPEFTEDYRRSTDAYAQSQVIDDRRD